MYDVDLVNGRNHFKETFYMKMFLFVLFFLMVFFHEVHILGLLNSTHLCHSNLREGSSLGINKQTFYPYKLVETLTLVARQGSNKLEP